MRFKLFRPIDIVAVSTITSLVFAGYWVGPTLAQIKAPESNRNTNAVSTDLLLRLLYSLGYTAKITFKSAA